jgi:hypothetical protein
MVSRAASRLTNVAFTLSEHLQGVAGNDLLELECAMAGDTRLESSIEFQKNLFEILRRNDMSQFFGCLMMSHCKVMVGGRKRLIVT